jgi:hypothetical protein
MWGCVDEAASVVPRSVPLTLHRLSDDSWRDEMKDRMDNVVEGRRKYRWSKRRFQKGIIGCVHRSKP